MPNSFLTLPIATIEKALGIRKQIEALEASLAGIYGGTAESVTPKGIDGRTGKRSAATRARMQAAQKARWAKKNAASANAAPAESASTSPKRKKRTMSPEGRARIAAAQRARWAKQKQA